MFDILIHSTALFYYFTLNGTQYLNGVGANIETLPSMLRAELTY